MPNAKTLKLTAQLPNHFPVERHRREIPRKYRLADFNLTLCTFSGGSCRLARHYTVLRSKMHLHYIKVINIAGSGPFWLTCRVTISKGCESHHTYMHWFRSGDQGNLIYKLSDCAQKGQAPVGVPWRRSTKQLQAEAPKLALHMSGLSDLFCSAEVKSLGLSGNNFL
jgi:hypothetical protein